jgi:CO/xanthine dehydrogenase Mo-binding subunit
VAEELGMDPRSIQTEFADVHPEFINPFFGMQITNASSSMITCYQPVREAAACVRTLLLEAAAQEWKVDPASLEMRDGEVLERGGDRRAVMGKFATLAQSLRVPENVELKPSSEFRFIGKFNGRLEAATKVNGSASYGIDAQVPDALTAVVVRCPHFGGTVLSFGPAAAKQSRGVVDVFQIDRGIAIVADNYWHARQAAGQLQVEWDKGPYADVSSESIARDQKQLLDEAEKNNSPITDELNLSVEYAAPFQAHACMEPMNATVAITDERVDVWSSNQAVDMMQAGVAEALNRPRSEVTIHNTFLGGGLGRRVYPDAVAEAAKIAEHVGRPVKTIWSREDDIHHDFYRPVVKSRMSGRLNGDRIESWHYCVAAPSHWQTLIKNSSALQLPGEAREVVNAIADAEAKNNDRENLKGAEDTPYILGEMKAEQIQFSPGIPVSFWRSVGHSFNGFFVEGFMDEMAVKAGVDGVEFRRNHLAEGSRERIILDMVAKSADWGNTREGIYQGVALDTIKGSSCAQVADIDIEDGQIRVHRIVCAVDCGVVINPDIVVTQIQSSIVHGLTATLKGEITIKNGAVVQNNFDDYEMFRMAEMPEITVLIVESTHAPSGVGECAVPPVAPAIANAVYAATGQRLRSLPLRLT